MTLNPLRILALLFAGLLLLGACGDDDSSSSTTTTSDPVSDDDDSTSTTEDTSPDGDSGSRDEYVAALEEEMQGVTGSSDDDGPRCVAEALVDAVGVDYLEAEGITVDEFTQAGTLAELGVELDESAIDSMAVTIDDCVDLMQIMSETAPPGFECLLDTLESYELSRAFAEDLASGIGFDPSTLMFASATPECAKQVFLSTAIDQGGLDQTQVDCLGENLDDEVPLRILTASSQGQNPDAADTQALEEAFEACGVAAP